MASTEKDFIVAIELGSSKISAIAGKKKDGTMHVLAYAEERTTACVKRGVVWNIEKTYQSVNSVIAKLENVLKTKVVKAYVGLAGQSLRSYRCVVKRNMLTQSYITNEAVDSIRQESYEIPFPEYEVLENFPQEYVIDQNVVADPVGVMGTNVEGEYLNVIAKTKLRSSLKTVFGNTNVKIADELIAPLELANNVLEDSEKRSGCALVDLGADTTTVTIYKNNIMRYLVTIPLGMNNVNKDLATMQIEDGEAEELKLKYGDMSMAGVESKSDDNMTYTTSDGRKLEVGQIRSIINARVTEIITNVSNQIIRSNYSEKLLAGVILTGGGSNMRGIDKAFMTNINVDKCRIARTINQPVVKTSNATGFISDSGRSNSLVSLLMAGTQPCDGGDYDAMDLFDSQIRKDNIQAAQQKQQEQAEAEKEAAVAFDEIKAAIRNQIQKVQSAISEVEKYGKDKQVRVKAESLTVSALEVLNEKYTQACEALEGKDKFKQSLREGSDLADMLRSAVDSLKEKVAQAKKDNSMMGRFKNFIDSVVNE
ncbi:MAG: cell division protein FtsA [Bacteroidaceae bacterium]|nr:cell division protein FtsA [Bacteroidaceae bacterium]